MKKELYVVFGLDWVDLILVVVNLLASAYDRNWYFLWVLGVFLVVKCLFGLRYEVNKWS